MHVGDKIKTLRERAGLTQPELAAMTGIGKSGVSQQTIGQLEQKKNNSCRKMPLIAKALGVVLDDLIDESIPLDQVRSSSPQTLQPSTLDISSLMSVATPRTSKALEEINQAAMTGKLSESDVELLNAIARKLSND